MFHYNYLSVICNLPVHLVSTGDTKHTDLSEFFQHKCCKHVRTYLVFQTFANRNLICDSDNSNKKRFKLSHLDRWTRSWASCLKNYNKLSAHMNTCFGHARSHSHNFWFSRSVNEKRHSKYSRICHKKHTHKKKDGRGGRQINTDDFFLVVSVALFL